METYYLVDLENVHSEGLKNINELEATDHVHIFYTENSPCIRLDIVLKARVDIIGHNVPVRRQSVDMHLVSYLGYLLGIDSSKQNAYCIISKDKDYDNIVAFWQNAGYSNLDRKAELPSSKVATEQSEDEAGSQQTETNQEMKQEMSKTTRRSRNKATDQQKKKKQATQKATKQSATKSASQQTNKKQTNKKQATAKQNQKKPSLNSVIQGTMAQTDQPSRTINKVASIVVKNAKHTNAKQSIHTALVKEFGQAQGGDFYKLVKKYV